MRRRANATSARHERGIESPEMTDHLHHWPAIADHLGVKPDAARHLAKTQGLPVYRLGRTVAASRTAIDLWRRSRIVAAQAKPE